MAIRSFIALAVSDAFKARLGKILSQLHRTKADVRWVKEDNIHLTLKFLGDLEEAQLAAVASALDSCCGWFSPPATAVTEIGAFPNTRYPKIWWAGLDDPGGAIRKIAEVIENRLSEIGFAKEERDFKPHITIGRVKSLANLPDLMDTIQQVKLEQAEEILDRIVLYQSTLTSPGPVYEVIKEFKTGG